MSNSKIISAIDIGSTKVTTLIAQHFPEDDKVNVIGVYTTPSKGIRKGQVINIEKAIESILESVEEAERMAGLSIGKAIVGITAPYISSINSSGVVAVSEPSKEISKEDVDRVIEAARAVSLPTSTQTLHVTPRQFIVDGQEGIIDPKGMTGVRLEVDTNIITGSSPAIKNLVRCINEVGIEIQDIAYSGLASSYTVLSETEKELGVILVDIGGTTTSIIVFIENSPCFARVIPVGSENVTNDLAIGLRLQLEEADKLKIFLSNPKEKSNKGEDEPDEIDLYKEGISMQEGKKISKDIAVDGIMKARVEEIFNLVAEQITDSGYGGSTPAGIVITGGGSMLKDIEKTCSKVIGLPVRIGYPKEMMGLVDEIMTPSYSSTFGLIEYAINRNFAGSSKQSFKAKIDIVPKVDVKGIFQKIVNMIKPLLP